MSRIPYFNLLSPGSMTGFDQNRAAAFVMAVIIHGLDKVLGDYEHHVDASRCHEEQRAGFRVMGRDGAFKLFCPFERDQDARTLITGVGTWQFMSWGKGGLCNCTCKGTTTIGTYADKHSYNRALVFAALKAWYGAHSQQEEEL